MADELDIHSTGTSSNTIGGGLDMKTELSGNLTTNMNMNGTINTNTKMTGDRNAPLATLVLGDPAQPVTMTIQGNPEKPVASTTEMLNLPRFTINDLKELATPKVRTRMPYYSQICFKLFGNEIFSFCFSGESQTIVEPYVPNSYERCEMICCEPDTRPFPEGDPDA